MVKYCSVAMLFLVHKLNNTLPLVSYLAEFQTKMISISQERLEEGGKGEHDVFAGSLRTFYM